MSELYAVCVILENITLVQIILFSLGHTESNSGVGINKKIFKKMANGLLSQNISGSPAVGARWKATKKLFFY